MTAGGSVAECLHLWTFGYAQPCTREPGHKGLCHYNNGPHAHPRLDQPCNDRCVLANDSSGGVS